MGVMKQIQETQLSPLVALVHKLTHHVAQKCGRYKRDEVAVP